MPSRQQESASAGRRVLSHSRPADPFILQPRASGHAPTHTVAGSLPTIEAAAPELVRQRTQARPRGRDHHNGMTHPGHEALSSSSELQVPRTPPPCSCLPMLPRKRSPTQIVTQPPASRAHNDRDHNRLMKHLWNSSSANAAPAALHAPPRQDPRLHQARPWKMPPLTSPRQRGPSRAGTWAGPGISPAQTARPPHLCSGGRTVGTH